MSSPLLDRVLLLARGLHARGFGVSPADTVDAASALAQLDLGALDAARRSELRACLRATLVKRPDPRGEFDALFDRAFPAALRAVPATPVDVTPDALVDALVAAATDAADLAELAAGLVDAHAGLVDAPLRGERHHVQRVLHAADLARLMMLALRDREDVDPALVRSRVDALKRLIAADVAERVAGAAGPDDPLPDLERIEFLNATRAQLADMRATVRPLARRIATRLAQRRQRTHAGRIDMRRTIRRAIATGGVPLDVVARHRRPRHPQLYVLSDVSGSVADFSVFTLTLVAALSAELTHTRTFVFVDAVAEITDLLATTGHQIEPWQILRNTEVIGATGHSDYGAVLEQFSALVGPDLDGRATVVVTGDARSNHRPAGAGALAELARRSRSVFWLNPEPQTHWGTHDSVLDEYRPHCTAVFEVRTLEQLEACIERIL